MKNCKFCAEQIQDDAVKCKHCGEWLDKPSDEKVEKLKNGISAGVHLMTAKFLKLKDDVLGSSDFAEPTDAAPLCIDKLILKSNTFIFDGKAFSYNQIASIYYKVQTNRTNGINVGTWHDLIIFVDIESNYPIEKRSKDGKLRIKQYSSIIYWAPKANKLIHNAHYILSERSFHARYIKYVNMIETLGYFYYPEGIKLHNDGQIVKGDKSINLKNSLDLGLVQSGISFRWIRSSNSDPYYFSVRSTSKIFSPTIQFELYYDRDLFQFLIIELLENGLFYKALT